MLRSEAKTEILKLMRKSEKRNKKAPRCRHLSMDEIRSLSLEYAKGNFVKDKAALARLTATQNNARVRGHEAACRAELLKWQVTFAENSFRKRLNECHIPFHFQKVVFTPKRYYILDFVLNA